MGLKRRAVVRVKDKRDKACDYMIDNIGNNMAWITCGVLESHGIDSHQKDFVSPKRVCNFYKFVLEEKSNWEGYENYLEIVNISKEQKPYIYQGCLQIPFSQLLFLAEIKPGMSSKDPHMKAYLQCAWIVIMTWADEVLKKKYGMSLEKRIDFMTWVIDWIDSNQKKLFTVESINQIFIEDFGWDLDKGVKVDSV